MGAQKAKFLAGQVVAECYDFRDGKGEFVKTYFALNKSLAEMYNKSNLYRSGTHDRWIRALTEAEKGGNHGGR